MDVVLGALRAAGERTRLRLLTLLGHGELTVSELAGILGQSQPRVSRHLKLLCDAGLLERYPEGTSVFYRLADRGDAAAIGRAAIDRLPPDDPALLDDRARLDAVRRARAAAADGYFRAAAADWDRARSLYADEREVERAMLDALGDGPLGALLDVGTGTGRILELLAPRAERAVGVDLSPAMLGVARATIDAVGRPTVQVRHGDMYHLAFPPRSFDLVVFHQVLHYADDPAAAVAEACRVLRPGGRVLVVDFAPHALEFLREEHAHRRLGFSDREVASWFRASGLAPAEPRVVPGEPLDVVVWVASRTLGTVLPVEVSRGAAEDAELDDSSASSAAPREIASPN